MNLLRYQRYNQYQEFVVFNYVHIFDYNDTSHYEMFFRSFTCDIQKFGIYVVMASNQNSVIPGKSL